jgi:3-oxoacyl-[acyl-carrier-protein] synthase II
MSRKIERVVITGMGVTSPLGCDLIDFWTALIAGRSGVDYLEGKVSILKTA